MWFELWLDGEGGTSLCSFVTPSDNAKIDFIKTATGYGNRVKLSHVKLIKPLLRYSKLKAAGGIITIQEVTDFFKHGADVIGSSKGFDILSGV